MIPTNETHTLSPVAENVFAYIAANRGWGWNNAGLIVSRGHGLLVDTLFDMTKTGQMLDKMMLSIPDLQRIDTVINTHGNGDHWFGNGHFADREIIASEVAVEDMREVPPGRTHLMMKVARFSSGIGPGRRILGGLLSAFGSQKIGPILNAGPFLNNCFGAFDFGGIEPCLPNRTFRGELEVTIGGRMVRLVELGPCHTRGDIVAFEPETRVLFAGDLLFVGCHPILWQGPVSNWISACERMLEWQPTVVVPGHGPLCDAREIEKQKDYFTYLADEAKSRYDRGMPAEKAARDIDLSRFNGLTEPERIAVNVGTLYREFQHSPPRRTIVPCFWEMSRFLQR